MYLYAQIQYRMSCKFHKAILHALLAAALYAVSIPFSKLLLTHLAPTMLAAFLYIGAGVGMAVMGAIKNLCYTRINVRLLCISLQHKS